MKNINSFKKISVFLGVVFAVCMFFNAENAYAQWDTYGGYNNTYSGYDNYGWDTYSNYDNYGWDTYSNYDNYGWDTYSNYDNYGWDTYSNYDNYGWNTYSNYDNYGWNTYSGYNDYTSYTPTYSCVGCDSSNYSSYTPNYSSYTPTYDSYTPTYGCTGSNCNNSRGTTRSPVSALGLNLNYSDNDTIITDNSRTDNSVRINNNIRNSSTTINTTNTCSNGNNASSSGNCNTTTINNHVARNDPDDDLSVICRVSDSSIEEGDSVTFSVEIRGGRPDFRIEWDGAISGDDDEERVRFNRSGTYRVTVEVRDANGDRDSDECTVRVRDEDDDDDDDDRRVTVTTGINTPTGNLASLDSVFLSQVPYTGPGDVAKVLGVLALVAVWSTVIALYLKKQRAVKEVSNKIAQFKEQNKSSDKI